jgi:hypothetical protein
MKSVLISIKPQWCEKIASGQCKILVRKSAPKEVPFKAYIYATKPKKFYKCGAISTSDELLWLANGKVEISDGFKFWADGDEYQGLNGRVIGEFICDKVEVLFNTNGNPENYMTDILPTVLQKTALSFKEFQDYVGSRSDKNNIYGWHISDLKIYDKSKELSLFYAKCNIPESKCKLCDNCFYKENGYGKDYAVKKLTRPPQSWMYVEEILL